MSMQGISVIEEQEHCLEEDPACLTYGAAGLFIVEHLSVFEMESVGQIRRRTSLN